MSEASHEGVGAARGPEAIQEWEMAGQLFPRRAWDWLFMAMTHRRLEEPAKAKECLDKALHWIASAKEGKDRNIRWMHWLEQNEVGALRREAEALVKGP